MARQTFFGSLKHWLGGLVNHAQTGQLSHSKVWANVAAAALTWKFMHEANAPEWTWWAYGGMVGGYGLAKRFIAGAQQVVEQKGKHDVADIE